jgi:hypothetical protein
MISFATLFLGVLLQENLLGNAQSERYTNVRIFEAQLPKLTFDGWS